MQGHIAASEERLSKSGGGPADGGSNDMPLAVMGAPGVVGANGMQKGLVALESGQQPEAQVESAEPGDHEKEEAVVHRFAEAYIQVSIECRVTGGGAD